MHRDIWMWLRFAMKEYSVGLRYRLRLVMLVASLALSLHMTGCCSTRGLAHTPLDPVTVLVNRAEIREGTEPGTYIVTDGWLAQRLQFEQALHLRLSVCEAAQEEPDADD